MVPLATAGAGNALAAATPATAAPVRKRRRGRVEAVFLVSSMACAPSLGMDLFSSRRRT
jgi:hypothetical protein